MEDAEAKDPVGDVEVLFVAPDEVGGEVVVGLSEAVVGDDPVAVLAANAESTNETMFGPEKLSVVGSSQFGLPLLSVPQQV